MRQPLSGPTHPSDPSEHPEIQGPLPLVGSLPSTGVKLPQVVLTGAWILVALIHLALAPEHRTFAWRFGYLLLEILASASLGFRAWMTRGEGRLAWWLLGVSALLDVFNIALQILSTQGHTYVWGAGPTEFLSLLTGILVLAGVLNFPAGREPNTGRWRRTLDGLLFAASLLFLLWVAGVHGALRSASQGLGLRVLVAYLNAALLGGGLVYLTSNEPQRFRGPMGWLGASALAWLGALFGWALAGLPLVPEAEWWFVMVGGIPLFQGIAAWSPSWARVTPAVGDFGKLARMLPYVPVVAALGVMAALIPQAPQYVMRGASGIFLAMVVLLLLRQFQAIQDLRVARRTLEDRVHQRTQALEQAQDTLLRTERMNTVALMGAGLAHDLNNLLSAMKSSAELAVMSLEEGLQPAPGDLKRIAAAADRAAMLTQRLMGLVRREEETLAPTDLGTEMKGIEVTLRLILPRSVDLRIEVAPGAVQVVRSSKLRLEQMLVNLVANARDAMPDGGRLTIRTGPCGTQADHAMIEVTDSGTGMPPEILARIFDPFFTTKPPGKGTGLGLPSLKALVEADGGHLDVWSEPGQGSRFRILLPRVPAG